MKKTIFTILFIFLFISNVKSLDWDSEIPVNKNIVIEKIEERYKWYKLNKTNERVENSMENNCEYFEKIETTFSDWNESIPEEKNNRIIEKKEEVIIDEYNIISFENFLTANISIKELKIKNSRNEILGYTITECRNCNASYEEYKYLYDNNRDTSVSITNNSVIRLKLDENCSDNPRIELYYNTEAVIFGWTVYLNYNSSVYVKKMDFNKANMILNSFPVSSYYIIPITSNWIYFENNVRKLYRYKDSLVSCYDYEKEYLDGYFVNVDNYIKDESSKISFYKYKEVNQIKEKCIKEENTIETNQLDDKNDKLAINYSYKKKSKDYSLIPVFLIALGGILILLVLICRKMRKNIKECR